MVWGVEGVLCPLKRELCSTGTASRVCGGGSVDSLQELVLFCYHEGPQDQTHITRPGSTCPINRAISPHSCPSVVWFAVSILSVPTKARVLKSCLLTGSSIEMCVAYKGDLFIDELTH